MAVLFNISIGLLDSVISFALILQLMIMFHANDECIICGNVFM